MFSQLVEYHIRNDLNLIKQSVLTFNSFFLRVGFLFLFFEESFRGLVFFGCDSNDQLQTDLPRIEAPLLHSIVTYIYICIWPVFSACDVHGRTLHLRPGILKVSFLSAKKNEKNRS